MKKYIYRFLIASALGISVAPAINSYNHFSTGENVAAQDAPWFDYRNLFNMDFLLPYLGYAFYSNGVSISPENAIVGKHGWLFLGDRFDNTLSESRGLVSLDTKMVDELKTIRSGWDRYVKNAGGKGYFVTIAPNSQTINQQMLPKWARSSQGSRNVNFMLNHDDSDTTLIDLSTIIKKKATSETLYYKTDTHWNTLGAWYGYKNLCSALQDKIALNCLKDNDVTFKHYTREGGDLSRFLHINKYVKDTQIDVLFNFESDVVVDTWDNKPIRKTDLNDSIKEMNTPMHVRTANALNNMKVLWLRDSYGIALYPFFNATFSDIMQKHYDVLKNDPDNLKTLINAYKPDLVIITAVERNYRTGFFFTKP